MSIKTRTKQYTKGKDIVLEINGFVPLARVPGKFVKVCFTHVFSTKFLMYEKEMFIKTACMEFLEVHFKLDATCLDKMHNIEDIDNNQIFSIDDLFEMVEIVCNLEVA